MLCIVPSVGLALNGFGGAEVRYASGLFNLMRNLGGAIGIATVNTWLQDNTRIEAAHMGQALGEAGRSAPDFIARLAARLSQSIPDPAQAPIPQASAPKAAPTAFNGKSGEDASAVAAALR